MCSAMRILCVKTLRYLKLLLCCKPELADYMSRVLPPALTASGQYSHCLHSATARCVEQHAVSHDTDDNRFCYKSSLHLFIMYFLCMSISSV